MGDITVDATVSLKLKLPPESAAIISEIIIGDRVFAPTGEHAFEIPTKVFEDAVGEFEKAQSETKQESDDKKPEPANSPSIPEGKRTCENPRCGKIFRPKTKRSRFCSGKCGSAVYQDEFLKRNKMRSSAKSAPSKLSNVAVDPKSKWPEDKLEAFKRWARLEAVSRYKKQPFWEQLSPSVPRIALKSAYGIPYDGTETCEEKVKSAFIANLEIFIETEMDGNDV